MSVGAGANKTPFCLRRGEVAGKERRVERQHAFGRFLVAAVAEREQARSCGAEIDYDEKESRERVDPKMRTDPWKSERQRERRYRRRVTEKAGDRQFGESHFSCGAREAVPQYVEGHVA